MSNPFSIEVGSVDGYTVIRLAGYVDAYTAPDFEAAVQAEVSSGRTRLIVDC
ncbi:MAG: STAS domain-containing protein [Acidobacteriota bacterium]